MNGFACQACGCPSIEVPHDFSDQAAIRCRDCGRALGTWGELKLRALTTMRLHETGDRRLVAADPLPVE